MDTASPAAPRSLRLLGVAPHRLLFFIGASNLFLAMLWWASWLIAQRWQLALPQPTQFAGWLHAYVMQYQMLPSFMFGFLLTVFPRWMSLPELPRWRYLPVGLGIFSGQICTLLGAMGWQFGILLGWFLTMAGWLAGLSALGPLLLREKGATWHARSCFAALLFGLAGLVAQGTFLLGAAPIWVFASIKLGTFGLLLPVYVTVAHRMFPFFAGSVLPSYQPWRPLWLLAVFWALCISHLGMELLHAYRWLWLADVPLFALTTLMCWRWWPLGPKPALLSVLFLALLWLPLTFALYAAQSLTYLLTEVYALGRAPAHALFIGFFASALIAMVTRVTQGHSGRPLVLPRVAIYAFGAIQVVALLRIAADVVKDAQLIHALAAIGWLLALGPWVFWLGSIYLSPRIDGKAG